MILLSYFLPITRDAASGETVWSHELCAKHVHTYFRRNAFTGLGLMVLSSIVRTMGYEALALFGIFPMACLFGVITGIIMGTESSTTHKK